MSDAWKQRDLAGGGLQSANIRLAALLKRRAVAYGLLLLFPLGLHRAYLQDRRGAWLYLVATALGAAAFAFGQTFAGILLAALITGCALYDIGWIENTVARINKRLRIEVYMSQTRGAPPGYAGRFGGETQRQRTAEAEPAQEAPPPSLAEQERRLRERAGTRRRQDE